tara:strand:+ start:560 stop:811 length:252 start_codon:yes stop_codon:yes gene_type:complete
MSEKKKKNNDYIYSAYADLIPDPQDGTYATKKRSNTKKLNKRQHISKPLPYIKALASKIREVRIETKWRDIFKIVAEAQKRLK